VKKKREDWCQKPLADEKVRELFEKYDLEMLEKARQGRCPFCGGSLHRGDYARKPNGGPAQWDKRYSLCCASDGCRRRLTPASVRFFGRRAYVAPFFLLVSALNHGLTPARVGRLSAIFGVDRHTLARWRQWWLENFVGSAFWKESRARFTPLLSPIILPRSLLQAFGLPWRAQLLPALKFLAPLTVPATAESRVM
jgi:hypothetical protein